MSNQSRTIVVTGSHSVGKTTLCNSLKVALAEQYQQIGFIPEVARILLAKGIPMNDSVSEFGIVSYLLEYLSQARGQFGEIVISDRSILDLFAYISVSRPSNVRDEFVQLVEEMVHAEISRANMYIYVPIEFALVIDDVRPAQVEYQRIIDAKIFELLSKFNANTLMVSGALNERVDQIISALQ